MRIAFAYNQFYRKLMKIIRYMYIRLRVVVNPNDVPVVISGPPGKMLHPITKAEIFLNVMRIEFNQNGGEHPTG